MSQHSPAKFPFDQIVATLVAGELAFSLTSIALLLLLQLRSTRSSSPNGNIFVLSSLFPVRLLLVLLASLLSLSELLRLPLLLPLSPRLCATYSFFSPTLAEPAFLYTLLFLIRANPKPTKYSPSFLYAFISALVASIPFLFLNAAFILTPNSFLARVGLPQYFLGHAAAVSDAFHTQLPRAHGRLACGVPFFSTVILAALASVYVPLFMTAIWSVIAIVINKRLRFRLYMLSVTVIAALSVQIVARALAALWAPASGLSQTLNLASFVSLLVFVVSSVVILVVQPVMDSLVLVGLKDRRLSDEEFGVQIG